ncbi:MAG TPA: ABC transporter substrate-binding protein [Acidimicrobiia bacterium]|jgi:ABC-type branched-subunit amino acid transport system substrate-binding protein
MSTIQPTRSAYAHAGVILLLVAVLAACGGSSGKSKASGSGSGTSTAAVTKPCPGTPLKFMTIIAISGPLGDAGQRTKTGTEAAVDAVNRDCALGRPLEVTICDDKADANASLACGRKAASNGTLAILGSVGSFDDGVNASKLPEVYGNGTSSFELTNPKAYSSISGLALGISATTAVKAKGAKSSTLVLPDTPTLQFAGKLVQQAAGLLNLKVYPLYFPQDTTDFAPLAAQIDGKHADATGMLPINPVVMINALAAEGLTPSKKIMVVPSATITPDIMKQLGKSLNGMLVVSQTAPPTDTANPGIAEFRADMKADGHDPDSPNVDFSTVTAWSNVKKLEGALLAVSPAVRASLDSKSLVDAVVANPIERPEAAPYDFRNANQLPELPALASFRVFTREVAVLQIENGRYRTLSDGFIDILKPPQIK